MTGRRLVVLVALSALPGASAAQSVERRDTLDLSAFAVVNGVVLGEGTHDPLPDALVYVPGEPYSAVTDSLGRYALPLPRGLWVVTVFHPRAAEIGLATPPTSMVTTEPGDPLRLDFALDTASVGSQARPYALDAMEVVVRGTEREREVRSGARIDVLGPDVLEERRVTSRHVGDLIQGEFIGVRVFQYDASKVCVQAPRGAMIRTGQEVECPGQVAVVLDGALLADPGAWLATLAPDAIERVEFEPAFSASTRWGLRGGNGVLYIYTR